jgi:hypothetical protein
MSLRLMPAIKRRCACGRRAAPGRMVCHRCRKRAWMLAHPIAYLFDNLRTHARTRRKGFQLTIEEFTAFCAQTRYHELKGLDPDSLTIDRIRPEQGYRKGNIRVLPHLPNSRRRADPPTEEDLASAAEF